MSFAIDEKLQRALDIGYAYLNRRERTVAEVRDQLERRGVAAELTGVALHTFAEQGFLDDERFARLFVSDKRELEQWGSERIRRGLLARGVDRALAERALAGGAGDEGLIADEQPSELDRALELLRRRFPAPPRERRERDRALGVLLRKGYESEVALDALSAYTREADS